jgi:NADH-quinone oxidoreductase subunit G
MTTTEPNPVTTGVPFTLNGKPVEATKDELLIDACDRNGVHIPRFCHHPRMKPVGMCRMCLVDVDSGRGPGLQPSCMVPVTPDIKVDTESEATKAAQDGVLEFLLINHPLDCPVCDKGGECPLQDNTIAFGPGESRFVEEKRHYEKPIPISDLVYLDRERCILCDRCTRFAKEVAGDPLIHFIGRGANTEVNTFPDHPFSSYFSGNTVQICPVGALTAVPYRFKARPWDLETVESTSTVDSTGARVLLQSSRNELTRVIGLDSDAVNWGWLSDKDRFAHEVTLSANRVTEPMLRRGGEDLASSRWSDAVKVAARALRGDPGRVAVLGGARLPLEGQYAWAKLMKGVIGTDHVDCQLSDGLPAPMALGLPRATIAEVCAPGGVVVLLGPDPKEELPTLFLRLRHAIVEDGVSLVELTSRPTSLSDLAAARLHCMPGTVGQVAAGLAAGVSNESADAQPAEAMAAARALLDGTRPVTVVLGRANLAESARYTADAVGALQRQVPGIRFLPALRRGNVLGALEMGLTAGFLPGGIRRSGAKLATWPFVPDFDGKDADGILRAAANGEIDTLVLLGSDPVNDYPDAALIKQAMERVTTVISVDAFVTASAAMADVILPAAIFGEVDGSFLNLEGRLSPLTAKVTPPGQAKADWMIAVELATTLGIDLGFVTLAELRSELSQMAASFSTVNWAGLTTGDDGPVIELKRQWVLEFGEAAAPPLASSYGLRLVVDHKLWDLGTMVQQSPSLAGLASPAVLQLNPADVEALRLEAGVPAVIDRDGATLEAPWVADVSVMPRTARMAIGLPGFDVRSLLAVGRSVTNVLIRSGGGH